MQTADNDDWVIYQDPSGFSIQHPPGWRAFRDKSGDAIVVSPDGRAFVRIHEMRGQVPGTAAEIVRERRFPCDGIFLHPFAGEVESPGDRMASCHVRFRPADGESAVALVTCEIFDKGAILSICAAREPNGLGRMGSTLWAIKRSYAGDTIRDVTEIMLANVRSTPLEYVAAQTPQMPDIFAEYINSSPPASQPAASEKPAPLPKPQIPALPPPAAPLTATSTLIASEQTSPPLTSSSAGDKPRPYGSAESPHPIRAVGHLITPSQPPAQRPPLTFVQFTDPQTQAFYIDVPDGWQCRGGLYHPGLGDRRMYVEALSPDNITVLFGDPNCPQIFYSNPMVWGESYFTYPQGTTFLNLAASGQKLSHFYLKNVAPQRFGSIVNAGERDRGDLAAENRRNSPQSAGLTFTAHEVTFRAAGRTGSCLGVTQSNGGSFIGDNWIGNVLVWLAPPGLEGIGKQVAKRMMVSFNITPQFNEIVMRDEMMIANNGSAAVMMQQQVFAAQQYTHFQQEQMGNQIVNQYWDQQRAHEAQIRSWEHNQSVNDGIFQRGSDAMLGVERLYDDVLGREYIVAAGSGYYWVDAASGSVVGTTTDTPPDYSHDYRMLKKL